MALRHSWIFVPVSENSQNRTSVAWSRLAAMITLAIVLVSSKADISTSTVATHTDFVFSSSHWIPVGVHAYARVSLLNT